jgi:biopolymer transport protein ExbB
MSAWIERGGPVMWPLIVLSMIAATFVIERLFFWRREARRAPDEVVRAFGPRHGLEDEEQRMVKRMASLDTIVTAAPLLGILGTVLGIIDSLELLSERASPDPLAVTGGVARALITTAAGLIVALMALFPLNYFRERIRSRLHDLESALRIGAGGGTS